MTEIDAGAAAGNGLAQRLVVLVDPDDRTGGRAVSREQFMAGIDDPDLHFSPGTRRAADGRTAGPAGVSRFAGANVGVGAVDRSATEVTDSMPSGPLSGLSRTVTAPQTLTSSSTSATASGSDVACGVTAHGRPSKRALLAASGPDRSEPAIGCPPT